MYKDQTQMKQSMKQQHNTAISWQKRKVVLFRYNKEKS